MSVFSAFKTGVGKAFIEEMGEKMQNLTKGGRTLTLDLAMDGIRNDPKLQKTLKAAFSDYRQAALAAGKSETTALNEFVIGVASELPASLRDDVKKLKDARKNLASVIQGENVPAAVKETAVKAAAQGDAKLKEAAQDLSRVVSPSPSQTTTRDLQAAAKAITTPKPAAGPVETLLNSSKIADIGGPAVTRALRENQTALDRIVGQVNKFGATTLEDTDRATLQNVAAIFVKESKGKVTPAQAQENLLKALGLPEGSKKWQEVSEILKTESTPRTPAKRIDPTFEEPAAPVTTGNRAPAEPPRPTTTSVNPDNRMSAVSGLTVEDLAKYSNPKIPNPELDPSTALREFMTEDELNKWMIYRNHVVTPTIEQNLRHAADRLEIVYKSTGTIDSEGTFKTIRDSLNDPSKQLLKRSISETGRQPATPLSTPKDILEAIRSSRPVTDGELTTLQTFFAHYDQNASHNAQRAATIQSPQTTALGKPLQMGLINAGRSVIDSLSKEGSFKRIPKNLEHLYNTGEELGVLKRFWSGVVENPLARRTMVGLGFATVVGVPGTWAFTNYVDPRNYSNFGTTVFNTVHQDWLSSSDLDGVKGVQESTKFMYNRLTLGDGLSNQYFHDFTRDITGVDLTQELANSKEDRTKFMETLYKAAANLRQNPSSSATTGKDSSGLQQTGYNANAMTAYKYALSRHLGMSSADFSEDVGKIADFARDAYVKSIAEKMASNSGGALRDQILKGFYGKSNLSDVELKREFATHKTSAAEATDPLLRLKVAQYLVRKNLIKEEEINDLTKLQTDATALSQGNIEADAVANDLALARGGRSPQPTQDQTGGTRNQEAQFVNDVNEAFRRAANDPSLGLKQNDLDALATAFNETRSGTIIDIKAFDKKLEDRKIPLITRQIIEMQIKELAP